MTSFYTNSRGDDDWDLAEGLDPEGPSATDLDQFGDELISCPHCKRSIYDQSEICPHCGWAMLDEPTDSKKMLVGIGSVVMVLLLVWFLL